MIEFANPWAFGLLLMPLIVHKWAPTYQTKQPAVQVPFFDILTNVLGLQASKGATRLKASGWQRFSHITGWLLLILAMGKPMWLGEPETRDEIGRDLMVTVDLSGSMETADFIEYKGESLSRLDAAKKVLKQFSEKRTGDRLGLILFGDSAFLQAPFTADHDAWNELLMQTRVAMAGPSTHLGDAIGLGIKTFLAESEDEEAASAKEKVMIVLTDGNDTDSLVPPMEAAKVAAQYDIRIHMVAMGNPETVGEHALDMEVIEEVARFTGGEAFMALSPAELAKIYQIISDLEPALYESFTYQPKETLHYIPVLILALNYLIMFSFYTLRKYLKPKRGVSNES